MSDAQDKTVISRELFDLADQLKARKDRKKELEDQVKALTAEIEALRMRKEIFDLIKTVPGVGRDVLYYRYIVGKSWLEVGKAVGYSKSRAHDIHNEALEFLENRTPSDSKV